MLSLQQNEALSAIKRWLGRSSEPIFYLAGYAGTGKTTIAREVPALVAPGRDVHFCAYTGKAASVLAGKGCTPARTIHSLLYIPYTDKDGNLKFTKKNGPPPNDPDFYAQIGLVIVDECSMLDKWIVGDLLSLGVKLLFLGDPGQLPPVKGTGFFDERRPDFMLTEIHRQAADSPIIWLARRIREGQVVKHGHFGDSAILPEAAVERGRARRADQLLVGRNDTRIDYNKRMRTALGRCSPMPVVGDKLVCLNNDNGRGIFNGTLWSVSRSVDHYDQKVSLSIQDDTRATSRDIEVREEFFHQTYMPFPREEWEGTDQFTYGYALTVHKSQGSQWNDVVILDETARLRDCDARRWLYTAITRAAQRVLVIV